MEHTVAGRLLQSRPWQVLVVKVTKGDLLSVVVWERDSPIQRYAWRMTLAVVVLVTWWCLRLLVYCAVSTTISSSMFVLDDGAVTHGKLLGLLIVLGSRRSVVCSRHYKPTSSTSTFIPWRICQETTNITVRCHNVARTEHYLPSISNPNVSNY